MTKKRWIWLISILAVLAISGFAIWYFFFKTNEEEFGEMDEPLMVQPVGEEKLSESILVTGEIIPEDEQKIFPVAEAGEIKAINVKEGQTVKAGDVLFSYDTTKVDAAYNKAVRDRDVAKRRTNLAQSSLNELRKQYTNMKKNPEVSRQELNEMSKTILDAEVEVTSNNDAISGAQDAINEAVTQKNTLIVKSKINGHIVKINKNLEPSENGSGGNEPVIHIVSSGPFKVVGSMSEFDTVKIKPQQAVIVRPKVFKDREWQGTIETVSRFPGGQGGDEQMMGGGGGGNVTMYPFKVVLQGDTSELRPGFHVSLEINVSDLENDVQLAVPQMALDMDEDGSDIVYVINGENILEKRNVVLGDMSDEFAGIAEGVEAGELVVINPYIIKMKNLEIGKEVKDFMNPMQDMEGMDEGVIEGEMPSEEDANLEVETGIDVKDEEPKTEDKPKETEPQKETEGSSNDETK